jgi:cell division septal protein FtsQ
MPKRKFFRKPHRIKKKKSIFKSRLFWFGILVLITIGGLFYLIVFSNWFQINKIEIRGNKNISNQEIKEIIQPALEQQIVFWNTRTIFLANLKELNKVILEKFPEIAKVELKRKFPETLTAIIEERKPVAVFYYQDKRFFLDKEAIIFKEIEKKEGINLLKIESLIGKQVLEKKLIEKIIKIQQKLNQKEIIITEAVIVSEERLNIKTLENWEIYFSLRDDISTQIFNLGVVMKERISPERRKNLQYIDLRFDKIFIYPDL